MKKFQIKDGGFLKCGQRITFYQTKSVLVLASVKSISWQSFRQKYFDENLRVGGSRETAP